MGDWYVFVPWRAQSHVSDGANAVREDYSADGDAWSRKFRRGYSHHVTAHSHGCSLDFAHDHARSRAYRWGEDGIAGVCDTHGYQNIAFAFWNEKEYGELPSARPL